MYICTVYAIQTIYYLTLLDITEKRNTCTGAKSTSINKKNGSDGTYSLIFFVTFTYRRITSRFIVTHRKESSTPTTHKDMQKVTYTSWFRLLSVCGVGACGQNACSKTPQSYTTKCTLSSSYAILIHVLRRLTIWRAGTRLCELFPIQLHFLASGTVNLCIIPSLIFPCSSNVFIFLP